MARLSPLVAWSQYLTLRGVTGLMHCFDTEQNLQTAATLGSMYYRLVGRHRRRAIANLSMSFPDWPRERMARVARQSMEHMFQLFMVDMAITPRRITSSSWPNFIRVGRVDGVMDRLLRREPIIFVTGHCGNWELLGYALAVLDYPLYALFRPLDNPMLNRWALALRQARGMRVITKWGGTRIVQGILRSGGRVAFIADQNAGDQGLFVPFFGRLASSYKSIGLLAMRYEVPIVAGCARRLGRRFIYEVDVVDVIRPEDWVDRPDPLFYITARYNRAIEEMIRAAPHQYLWMHRRWKSRPRHERQGRPIPERLVEKLRTLPWLDEAEIERIVEQSNEAARAGRANNRQDDGGSPI